MEKILKSITLPFYRFLTKRQVRYKILPIFTQLFSYNRKEEILQYAMGFVNFTGVEGDYLEFGTWKGSCMVSAFHISKMFKELKGMKFYGFDSFQGLPAKKGVDAQSAEFKEGDYSCTVDDVKENIKQGGVPLDRVSLVPGWFDESLNEKTRKQLPVKKASIIVIDCDLYESTVPVLKFITPYITDGTVLIFDDWYCFKGSPDRGEQKAFREWLSVNPQFKTTQYRQFGWMGNSFIMHV